MMLAHTLVFTWAEAAAFRFFSTAKAERNLADHFATLIALALTLGATALIVTVLLLRLLNISEDIAAISAFAAGSAVFRFLTRTMRETERAAHQTLRFAIAETAYLGIGFAAGVALLVKFDLGPIAPFAGLMLSGTIMLLLDGPRLFDQAHGGHISFTRMSAYAGYGAPLALALAVDLGVQTLCRFLIAAQAGESALGAYSAAFGLARLLDLVFLAAGAGLAPLIFTAFEQDGADGAKRQGALMYDALMVLAAPAALGLVLVAAPLASVMIGPALSAEAALITPWLALAGLISGFNLYYLSEAFQLTRKTGLRAIIMLAPAAVQIALTLAWTHHAGALGAAQAALAGALASALTLSLSGRRLIALPLFTANSTKTAVALCVMTAAVLVVPGGAVFSVLIGKAAAGAAAYFAAAYALDLCALRALVKSILLEKTHVHPAA
jgi:O-antigen/teichoic acid export membrane protein